jgi:glycine oxidase
VANHANVFAAVGHFRAGIQLSLGTARMIRDLVTKCSPIVDPAAFALDRIPNFHARPAFRS